MPKRVFLHLGPPKTGTSSIQAVLWANTAQLERAGLTLPSSNAWSHRFASRTLRGDPAWTRRPDARRWGWDRLARQVRAARNDIVFSAEDLSAATPEQIARAVDSLQPATIHVVATARDLGRQLPSVWQNSVKNGRIWTLDEFMAQLARGEAPFWRSQDVPSVLRRWLQHVPPERVHVVTVPKARQSAGLLWDRFAGVIGLDPRAVSAPPSPRNVSLGAVQTEVLRKLYARLGSDQAERVAHYRVVRHDVIPVLLDGGAPSRPIRLPAEHQAWVAEQGRRVVAELQALAVDVRGEWDDLLPDEPAGTDEPVTSTEELDVALGVLGRFVARAGTAGSPVAAGEVDGGAG